MDELSRLDQVARLADRLRPDTAQDVRILLIGLMHYGPTLETLLHEGGSYTAWMQLALNYEAIGARLLPNQCRAMAEKARQGNVTY